MRLLKILLTLALLGPGLLSAAPALAHANLIRSQPPANASLDQSPTEIRLWFTEPLEPGFSRIILRDANGETVDIPTAEIDPTEPKQMIVAPGDLPQGLYTVSWRVVSAADGHPTEGSFAFGIGTTVAGSTAGFTLNESVPADGVAIRWLNLLSLCLLVGSTGFMVFVWQPAAPDHPPAATRMLKRLITGAWLGVGLTTLFVLLLQASIAVDTTVFEIITHPSLGTFLASSSYARLWSLRLNCWLLMGGALILIPQDRYKYPTALLLSAGILLAQSLFSHASAMPDTTAAVLADWLHLLATTLWIGGLVAFGLTLTLIQHHDTTATLAGRLVGYFSNYVRVAVAALIITGAYAAWLQVGSVEALLTTIFGQALLVKLILFVPLLAVAFINLTVTHRKLRAGQAVWAGRLRGLVGAEVVLTIGILIAVGVMTSGAPARGILAQRQAIAEAARAAQANTGYFGMQMVNNQMVHLEIYPGYVGENTFIVTPFDETGRPIEDASLIRLRFTNRDQNLGESELRPEYDPALGVYVAAGANLSTPGDWRIRMTIQRPGEFDTVVDFESAVSAAPPPPAPPVLEDTLPRLGRAIAAGLTGALLLVFGGFALVQGRQTGPRILAAASAAVGVVGLLTGALTFSGANELVVRDAWARPAGAGMTAAVYLTLENHTGQDAVLTGARVPVVDTVEIHETRIENDLARMIPLDELVIPAGGTVNISPAGYHLMLIDLREDLNVGDTFPITLQFASGQEITLDVQVQFDR